MASSPLSSHSASLLSLSSVSHSRIYIERSYGKKVQTTAGTATPTRSSTPTQTTNPYLCRYHGVNCTFPPFLPFYHQIPSKATKTNNPQRHRLQRRDLRRLALPPPHQRHSLHLLRLLPSHLGLTACRPHRPLRRQHPRPSRLRHE